MLSTFIKKITVIHASNNGSNFDFCLLVMEKDNKGISIVREYDHILLADIMGMSHDRPIILIITGRGVVTKDFTVESEEVGQIINHPDDFLFAVENIEKNMLRVTFLRRKLYDTLCRQINIDKLPVIEVRIDARSDIGLEAISAAEEFWTTQLGIKDMLTPSTRSGILLSLLAKQIVLPVLAILLVILLGNFFIQQHINVKLKEQQVLLSQALKSSAQVEKKKDQKQLVLGDLVREVRYPYSWIADRIASVVPHDVILSELAIQPVQGRVQENKPVVADENHIIVKGRCRTPESVTSFADSIYTLGIFNTVQLSVFNRDRDDNFQFNLEIAL